MQPTTVHDASKALADYGEKAKIYAGGAELLLLMRHGLVQTEVLVNIKKIERLNRVIWDRNVLRVGACVTHYALETSHLVREHASLLADAESQVANVRVRNQGTLGGNLCFNDPHSDPGTVLLVHEASVTLGSQRGERQMPLNDFFLDMYTTALEPEELLLEIQIPPLPEGMEGVYVRLHRYQRPTLGVAAAVRMNNGTFEEMRLAVGCIGPTARRLPELESKIKGAKVSEVKNVLAEQKSYLRNVLQPMDDLLGSAEYKLYMTGVLLYDALQQACTPTLPLPHRGVEDELTP
ncbi:MAG TPA: xanthine dehydrogenase family protein subunit M, partial [Candidatus Binatia bacterium]|nr:xanthine dehydrogenase family protein subunit M [Candidatus Binatia bacterium]